MKITIIGAAGFRTPLLLQSIIARQARLGFNELALMDIDQERLELIGALSSPIEKAQPNGVSIYRTTDPIQALEGADFVITTFRVGGIESRAIDERVPLKYNILGQETTGPGGFAMGLRSISVLLDYVKLMSKKCPDAWLINFANPAGMLTEAVLRNTGWLRIVGICDAPTSMHSVISGLLNAQPEELRLDYFGLNHLGWIKRITYHDRDYLPGMLEQMKDARSIPGLPFDPEFIRSLGMIPNEYLYYYYYSKKAVTNILKSGESRGEQLTRLNISLLGKLKKKYLHHDIHAMQAAYQAYLTERGETYMVTETGMAHDLSALDPNILIAINDEGYAGVALNLIEALKGSKTLVQIINIANQGSIDGMSDLDVVEIPARISRDHIEPVPVGVIPDHCLGLIKQVKKYEQLTIEAALQADYAKAVLALTIHPLVQDYTIAKAILAEYITLHKVYFPELH